MITGCAGSGKTFFLEEISRMLVNRKETVFLVNAIDYLPIEVTDPSHEHISEKEKQKPLLGLFQGCINYAPCWLFIDNFDLLAAKHESSEFVQLLGSNTFSEPMENLRILFLTLLDRAISSGIKVVVTVENEKYICNSFTRAGRFDRVLHIPIPSKEQRSSLLSLSLQEISFSIDKYFLDQISVGTNDDCNRQLCEYLAERTPGFVVRDLRKLVDKMKLSRAEKESLVTWQQVDAALKQVQPSQKHYFESQFTQQISSNLDGSVAGCHELSETIKMFILLPLRYPDKFAQFNLSNKSTGMLLYGPPGCGKTFATKILLHKILGKSVNIISVQGPRLFSKYVGDTEQSIRSLFATARKLSPSVLLIDELDSVGGKRRDEESGGVHERALSTLLNEMDGIEERQSVYIIGCTNRPDLLDSAVIRPGRLDRLLYLGPPTREERNEMLKVLGEKMPFDLSSLDKEQIINRTNNYSYADIKNLCREAALCALRHNIESTTISANHFSAAFMKQKLSPKSSQLSEIYRSFNKNMDS